MSAPEALEKLEREVEACVYKNEAIVVASQFLSLLIILVREYFAEKPA